RQRDWSPSPGTPTGPITPPMGPGGQSGRARRVCNARHSTWRGPHPRRGPRATLMTGGRGVGMEAKLLRDLTEEERERVFSLGRRRRFARREMVWHEGDRADTIHFIRSGRIAVQVSTPSGDVATVAVMGPDEAV